MIDEKKLLENRPEYLNPNMDDEIKSAHNKGWNDCNKYQFNIIEEQLKVNEWTPCSERLPENETHVLVQWRRYFSDEIHIHILALNELGEWYCDLDCINGKAIAWQPLPEPYREESVQMNEKIKDILKKHKDWLDGESDGERADLRFADLRCANLRDADLQSADLRRADLRDADLQSANLRRADLRGADLQGADLRFADLQGANLQGADLRGANLDFSCFPLWCGGLDIHLDDRQLIQIAYHLVKNGLHSKNASEETKKELAKLIDFANRFHRVDECGEVDENDR